jgi:hypothetical protein
MRPVEIHGYTFELADKWEVTQESLERVENLIPRLFFAKINPAQFMTNSAKKGNAKKSEEDEINALFADLLEDPDKFVSFLRLMSGDKSIQSIMGAMLTTGKDYYELVKLPALVLRELIVESEKEIGTFVDFTATFNLNTSSNPLEMLGNIQAVSSTS